MVALLLRYARAGLHPHGPSTSSRSPTLAGEHAHARQGRRLRQAPPLVHASLSGDLLSRGYFSAELEVGTPPQRFSLIVDTGSSVTALACTGCTRCGPHAHPRFAPLSSTSFEAVRCDWRCASCERLTARGEKVCGYQVTYQEGSSYSGYLARDVARLGLGSDACISLPLEFGCATDESGLFQLQRADGIMGLASASHAGAAGLSPPWSRHRASVGSGRTVLDSLVSRGVVDDAFSLCLGREQGVLTFGLPPSQPATFWNSLVEGDSYYTVRVRGVAYGSVQLAPGQLPSSCIVDSGTTYMYLHSAAFAPLLAALRQQSEHCSEVARTTCPADELCVRVNGSGTAALDACFSEISVALQGGTLSMQPSQYFYKSTHPSEWCLGVFDNYDDGLVLGAINLMNHQVTFDRAGHQVGFARVDCLQLLSQRIPLSTARTQNQTGPLQVRLDSLARGDDVVMQPCAPIGQHSGTGGIRDGESWRTSATIHSTLDQISLLGAIVLIAAMAGCALYHARQICDRLYADLASSFVGQDLAQLNGTGWQFTLVRLSGWMSRNTSRYASRGLFLGGYSAVSALKPRCGLSAAHDEDDDSSSDHFLLQPAGHKVVFANGRACQTAS
ncbi:hypothetical protein AB1Y20_006361 [Prymnesium parvum]|uniref:Peptidase A1 domain-containing protein n=1 Tax=Prymnesium parvum TaxID=97485 RepID=A0AB34J5P8_PRYPA